MTKRNQNHQRFIRGAREIMAKYADREKKLTAEQACNFLASQWGQSPHDWHLAKWYRNRTSAERLALYDAINDVSDEVAPMLERLHAIRSEIRNAKLGGLDYTPILREVEQYLTSAILTLEYVQRQQTEAGA
jgi:hypothetical protein